MGRLLGLSGVLALVIASAAFATKPGPGTSSGPALVFAPKPVQDLGNQNLTDQKDADYAALQPAYRPVTLTDLDGSGFLHGRWAVIVSETGNPAYSPTTTFRFDRHDDEFEQVMAYYWITEAQKYIQSPGFGSSRRPVNMEPQRLRINQREIDNSFATTHKDEIRLGKGGVDDAEEGEVILHEYGHAIHFAQDFQFNSTEAGAISEGFGDYRAVTVFPGRSSPARPARVGRPRMRCRLGRRVVRPHATTLPAAAGLQRALPESLVGAGARGRRIWSRALWEIRGAVGNVKADTAILESQFGFDGGTMPALAQRIVATTQSLHGNTNANAVRAVFHGLGILP
jgi:hypothetical protein